jgi:hypothetical protein
MDIQPPTCLSTIWPEGEQRPEQHRCRLGRGQHGLRLDAPLELQMQTLDGVGGARRLPLFDVQPREREELVAGFLQAGGDGSHLSRHLRMNALRRFSTARGSSA